MNLINGGSLARGGEDLQSGEADIELVSPCGEEV